jgi:glycosyltransferase involved in cell wall biosynthesis
MTVDYSIVIPAFNEEAFLPATLTAVCTAMAALPGASGELIVVDNNSTDRTAAVARSYGATVVFEPVNQISRARNCGAAAAVGRYLLFVDADTVVGVELLRAALAALESGKVCGGGARVGTSEQTHFVARLFLWLWNALAPRLGYAAGAFVYCRREGWEQTGGFSHDLYASEEIAFSRMLRRWGRERGMAFKVLPQQMDTSMRKARWYGPWRIVGMMLPLLFMPWRLRSRRHCSTWYERPATTAPASPPPDEKANRTRKGRQR